MTSVLKPSASGRASQASVRLPRLVIASGTLEALKWLALVAMLIDHINKYLLDGSVPWMFRVGRLAMPLFVIVLACKLARPGVAEAGGHVRTARRLAIGAMVASIPFIALGKLSFGGWWPLNILVTLLASVLILQLWRGGFPSRVAAVAVFIVGGAMGEFFWPAIVLFLAVHAYARTPSAAALVVAVVAMAAAGAINGNHWAFCALAVVAASTRLTLNVPRHPWLFYALYPGHLTVLWVVKAFVISA